MFLEDSFRRRPHLHSLPPPLSCFLQNNLTFYISVVTYAALVFLFNVAVKNVTIVLKGGRNPPG